MATSSENWKQEAEAVINDVSLHVNSIEISQKLKISDSNIYLNVTTIEGNRFCVELSSQGFRIVGNDFNENIIDSNVFYETPYSLLNDISDNFKESFANLLQKRLNGLLT